MVSANRSGIVTNTVVRGELTNDLAPTEPERVARCGAINIWLLAEPGVLRPIDQLMDAHHVLVGEDRRCFFDVRCYVALRDALEEEPAVSLCLQPRVKDRKNAFVSRRTYQPA